MIYLTAAERTYIGCKRVSQTREQFRHRSSSSVRHSDCCCGANEAMIFWGHSTDNVTAQEHIRYELRLNGQFEDATIFAYRLQFSMYLKVGAVNTIEVFAVDEARNRSLPATMTVDLR